MELLMSGATGRMVAMQQNRLGDVDLRHAAGTQRVVPLDEPLIAAARAMRTCFGDQEGGRRSARTRQRSADMPLADS